MKGVSIFLHSVRFRLVVWFTFILALVLFAFSSFIYFSQARDVRGEATYRLSHKMDGIEQVFVKQQSDQARELSLALQENDIFVLLGSDGQVVASYGIDSEQEVVDLATQAQLASEFSHNRENEPFVSWIDETGPSRQHYFFIAKLIHYDEKSPTGLAILGSPFDPYNLNGRLLITLLIGSGLTLAIAMGGGLWLADRAMRPVKTITQAAQTISETDLSRRLNLKSKDELGELANTFDGMLARLQAAFERQRQFVADASHELRTPLTIVNLEANRALSAHRSGPEYERALNVIRSENEFMTRLVNDLLTLARMDSGQMAMEKTPVDLSDIAVEAIERLAPVAERNNVKLETGELPETRLAGDRRYLLQMMSNLIENGIKYTSGEDRRVKVETGQAEDSVWVRVSDNGVGIPEEHFSHLFDRFYRIDKSRTQDDDHAAGSGLGLSIVHWIAQAHNGTIHIESKVGDGTVFEARFKTK